MNAFASMTVARRLGLGFTAMALLALATALAGSWGLIVTQGQMRTLYEDRTVALKQLGELHYQITRSRVLLMDATLQAKPETAAKRVPQYEAARAAAAKEWKDYMATRLTEEETALAKTLQGAYQALVDEGFNPMAAALTAANFDEARLVLDKRVSPLNPAFTEGMTKLMALQVRVAAEEFAVAQETTHRAEIGMGLLVILALVGGLGLGLTLTRSVVNTLGAEPHELAALAQRIAQGHLAADRSPPARNGSVMADMQTMRESLVQVVSTVRSGVDSVATASAEIAQGNANLSSRTEEQASSLQQTAASMEQLTGTVRHGADNARQANQLAQDASVAAVHGGDVVAQVVQTMDAIQASSGKIAEITGVIDGIAFQTNILALNAAVEAARAGEQGRGFAVVASEVRTLAQRSAEAAQQIKHLIADSVAKVDAGHQLVRTAGTSIGEVVSQVQRVSSLIADITTMSNEQSQGIDQVGHAVSQLDQATQQNAALVEESAAAAESLKAQAARLAASVAVFRLEPVPG